MDELSRSHRSIVVAPIVGARTVILVFFLYAEKTEKRKFRNLFWKGTFFVTIGGDASSSLLKDLDVVLYNCQLVYNQEANSWMQEVKPLAGDVGLARALEMLA